MTIEEELTYIAKTVVLEPQKLKGSNSRNKITDLGNGYLLKEYTSVEKCKAEYIAAALVGECLNHVQNDDRLSVALKFPTVKIVVPKIIKIGERTNLIQKFDGYVEAYELIKSAQQTGQAHYISDVINNTVANYLYFIYVGYCNLFSGLEYIDIPTFDNYLCGLNTVLNKNATEIVSRIGAKKSNQIQKALLACLNKSESCGSSMTILHRDLHLSNILVKPDLSKVAIIDFEHTLIGPIEFELQNSLVFDDCKSLDVRAINDLFDKFGVDLDPQALGVQSWVFLGEQLALNS